MPAIFAHALGSMGEKSKQAKTFGQYEKGRSSLFILSKRDQDFSLAKSTVHCEDI